MNELKVVKLLGNAGATFAVLRRVRNASVFLQSAALVYTSLVCGLRIGARLRGLSARD